MIAPLHPQPTKRILMLADWHGASTGFGTVTKNLLPIIQKSFQVTFVAINYFGEPYSYDNVNVVSAVNFFTPPETPPDPFGRYSYLNILANDQAGFDLCFIIQDIGIIQGLIPTMQDLKNIFQSKNRKNFKSAIYFPIDGAVPKGTFNDIHFFDLLITYNNYSRDEVIRHRPDLKKKIRINPHGTNTNDFFVLPQDRIEAFRAQYFGVNAGKVIIATVNRNQPRKAIGDTILSFIEARKIWKGDRKLFLYLHMMDADVYMAGYDLKKIFACTDLVENEDYMIADQKLFTEGNGADISVLRGIYNASDVFVTNTLGEGWSLSVTEAMSCHTPVIAPNHTSFIEIGDNGKRLYALEELDPHCCNAGDSTIRLRSNIYETAEKIVDAAEKRISSTDTQMLDAAEKYVRSLKWSDIADRFISYFEELM